MTEHETTLLFFRHQPDQLAASVPILSSMQSLETSFFLVALHRYPHALSICASAIEGAIKASPAMGIASSGLDTLIKAARKRFKTIDRFPQQSLDDLRRTRNQIIHFGFSPEDESKSTSLLLEVGIPFLSLCYQELHSFDLMGGLLPEYVEHLDVARKVHEKARNLPGIDLSYCLNSFGHLIRWCFKRNFSAEWEIDTLVHAKEIGAKFDRTYKETQALEQLFGAYWSFDCPVCDDVNAAVCEIDENELYDYKIVPKRMVCTSCGFVVHDSDHFLSEVLLEKQVADLREEILKEYGMK